MLVSWNLGRPDEVQSATRMLEELRAAGLPVLPHDSTSFDSAHERLGAWRNAADAKVLGAHLAEHYGLDWEWVHIDKDERITVATVAASVAFVDGLGKQPGQGGAKAKRKGTSGNR